MATQLLAIEEILTRLQTTPPQIAAATADLDPAQLRAAPHPGEWSVVEVLAHLRACADVWGDCMVKIAGGTTTLRAVNPRTWAESTDYTELEFAPSFEAFTSQRAALLAFLQPLPPADWRRVATITGAGRPLERSVHFYADLLTRHERTHVKQIGRIVAVVRE